MYNYFKDTNLNEVYEYLLKNNMLDSFIKSIVLEDKDYKKMIKHLKEVKKTSKKQVKSED